jgi:hypothetical protein
MIAQDGILPKGFLVRNGPSCFYFLSASFLQHQPLGSPQGRARINRAMEVEL